MAIFSHRGRGISQRSNVPDNSREALTAVANFATKYPQLELGIEFDVWFTDDNIAVLNHDPALVSHVPGGNQNIQIGYFTYSELKEMFPSTYPLRLDEALDIVRPVSFVNIELKAEFGVEHVLREAGQSDIRTDRIILSSFRSNIISHAHALRERGAGSYSIARLIDDRLTDLRPSAIAASAQRIVQLLQGTANETEAERERTLSIITKLRQLPDVIWSPRWSLITPSLFDAMNDASAQGSIWTVNDTRLFNCLIDNKTCLSVITDTPGLAFPEINTTQSLAIDKPFN